jgi:hypothetical protein
MNNNTLIDFPDVPGFPPLPLAPRTPILPSVPTHDIHLKSRREELAKLRDDTFNEYVTKMHNTLTEYSKIRCPRNKIINDNLNQIIRLISMVKEIDNMLLTAGKRSKTRRKINKKKITRKRH